MNRKLLTVVTFLFLVSSASCTRVPKTKDGDPLYWCSYYNMEHGFVDSKVMHASDRLLQDMGMEIPDEERTPERALQQLGIELPNYAEVDADKRAGLRIYHSVSGHNTLLHAMREQASLQWSTVPEPHSLNWFIVADDRRFGLVEQVSPRWSEDTAGFSARSSSCTTLIHYGSPLHGGVGHRLWKTDAFAIYSTVAYYHGPLWIVIVILIAIPATFFYILRRPIGRVLNLRRNRS